MGRIPEFPGRIIFLLCRFGTADIPSRWAMADEKQPPGSPTLTGIDTSDAVPPLGSSQIRYAKRGRHLIQNSQMGKETQ